MRISSTPSTVNPRLMELPTNPPPINRFAAYPAPSLIAPLMMVPFPTGVAASARSSTNLTSPAPKASTIDGALVVTALVKIAIQLIYRPMKIKMLGVADRSFHGDVTGRHIQHRIMMWGEMANNVCKAGRHIVAPFQVVDAGLAK